MKRWLILAVFAVVLSSAATVAVQYMGASTAPVGPGPVYPVSARGGPGAAQNGAAPKAVLEGEPIYYFGTLPQRYTGKHAWVVRNEGKGELTLWMISSTCSCTLAKFRNGEKAVVPPGESTEIVLEFETRENNGGYEKGAEIGTNDPGLPQFSLHVKGMVFPAVLTFPPGNVANFSSISNDEPDHKTYVAVYSKDKPDLKIEKVTSSKPELVTVDTEPLPAGEAKQLGVSEKGAYKLTVHARSEMPLGNFREVLLVKTNHPQQPEIQINVVGKMTGPISVIPGALMMHQVDGKAGGYGGLLISVRGGRDTKFEVIKAPKGLDASVSPGDKKGVYRLLVAIPPGTPAQEIGGDIVLKTDHPAAGTMTVPVDVWVQNAN